MNAARLHAKHRVPTLEALTVGNSLAGLDAGAYLAAFAAGRVRAVDFVGACMDRIERLDPAIGAFKVFDRDRAMERARRIDAEFAHGGRGQALAGVPVGVKDIFNTYDFPTGMGSPILEGYQPGNDARAVSDIRLAQGVVVGKTVTSEFAVHAPGPTRNPHDLDRSPGTSSSGSAAAVASYMVPVALASQTAGSIVRPASYCGVMGFKPSFGLIARTAMLKTTDTLDTVGFLARSVGDLELMLETTRVRGRNYPVSEAGLARFSRRAPDGIRWRIGVARGPKSDDERPAVRACMAEAARRLADAGCDVREYVLPPTLDEAHELHETIYRRSLNYYFRYEWRAHSGKFSPQLRAMIEGGLAISPETYRAALARQTEISRQFQIEAESKFDALICPATADEAPRGLDAPDLPDHCLIWTFVGAPVISLPVLSGTTGLPVGLQLVARRFADYRLLDFARFAWRVLSNP